MPRTACSVALLTCLFAIAWAAPASAQSVTFSVGPELPATSTVGDRSVPSGLVINNTSSGVGPVTLTDIRLVRSCGVTNPGCPLPDAGVFSIDAVAIGRLACAGVSFSVNQTNASTGEVVFTPTQPVVLNAPGTGGSVCVIDFEVGVLRLPSFDALPSPGVQTYATATVSGSAVSNTNSQFVAGQGSGAKTLTVNRGTATVTGTATPQATLGESIADSLALTYIAGSAAPTGTVTFAAYGPEDPTCFGQPLFQSTQPVVGVTSTTASASSGSFTPSAAGIYRWVATYSGDANYLPTSTPCGAPDQASNVSRAAPALSATASADVVGGGALSDSATVSGGVGTPTGTIKFDLYGPDDATCSGTVAFSSTAPLANGTAGSGNFSPTQPGSYRWIATYSGDAKYLPAATACGADSQTRTVTKASPSVSQTPSGTVPVGQAVSDSAQLSGGVTPTGTLTFRLFGPGGDCTGTPVTTVVKPVDGNGSYSSGDVVVNESGNYQWVVTYSGDARNAALTTTCGAANVAVTQPGTVAPPVTITPPAQPPVLVKPVAPLGLSVRAVPRRDRRIPYVYRFTGKLALPSSLSAAAGCLGKVTVRVKNGSKTISTRTVALKDDCTYASKVRFTQKHRLRRRGGRLKVLVTFLGNARLTELSAPAKSVRYR